MSYTVNKSDGEILVIVEDGTADLNSTSVAIVGRNFAGYGELLNENFVHMLENFAHTTAPRAPLIGQLWYDKASKLLKVYDGTSFISSGGGIESDTTGADINYFTFVGSQGAVAGITTMKTAGSKGITIKPSSGYMAINKSSEPLCRLEINGSTNAGRNLVPPTEDTVLQVHGDVAVKPRLLIDSYGGNNANSSVLTFRRTTASTSAVQIGNVLGSLTARGWTGAAFSGDTAEIRFVCSQSWSTTANGTRIEFLTNTDFTTQPVVKAVIHQNGDLEVKGDIIGFSLSDQRLKENIEVIDSPLEKLHQLQGFTFNWNKNVLGKNFKTRHAGVNAQQVLTVLPEAVTVREDGYFGVDYEKLVPLLVEAVKQLSNELSEFKSTKFHGI